MSEEKRGAERLDTSSTDAMHWAECFCEQIAINSEDGVHLEPDFLMGWLANYWAAIHDPLQSTIQSQQAEIERLQECLQEIIDEKRLHGQVVDGIVKARRLLSTDRGECCLSALQSSRGVEENWIDELGYYVQYAFDHCDELMEKFYPSIMPDFEFDEFYMSKSLCRLQVTQMHTAVSMSLVISTPDYIEWVQTMEDSHDAAS